MNTKDCLRRRMSSVAIVVLLALSGRAVAQAGYGNVPVGPPHWLISVGLIRAYLFGVDIVDVDARFDRFRVGATLAGMGTVGFSEALWRGPSVRAGYTLVQRPRRWIGFGPVEESRAGFYALLPELYVQAEHYPVVHDFGGDEYFEHISLLTLNLAWEHFFVRPYIGGGVSAAYNSDGWQKGWNVGPTFALGITLGSFTVGF